MFKAIAKLTAYAKAPVKTFAVLHPFKALKWMGIFLIVGTAVRRSTRGKTETRPA